MATNEAGRLAVLLLCRGVLASTKKATCCVLHLHDLLKN